MLIARLPALSALSTILACAPTPHDSASPTCAPILTTIAPATTETLPLQPPLTVLLCPVDGTPCAPTLDYTITSAGLVTITAPDWATVAVWSME